MKPVSDRLHLWLWILATIAVLFLAALVIRGAQGPAIVDKPRFDCMTVVAAYNTQGEMINCVVHASFTVTSFNPDGLTLTTHTVAIPDFDLVKEQHQTIVNAKMVQTSFGELADDVLAALEFKLKTAHPGPLPTTRKALREPGGPK